MVAQITSICVCESPLYFHDAILSVKILTYILLALVAYSIMYATLFPTITRPHRMYSLVMFAVCLSSAGVMVTMMDNNKECTLGDIFGGSDYSCNFECSVGIAFILRVLSAFMFVLLGKIPAASKNVAES